MTLLTHSKTKAHRKG